MIDDYFINNCPIAILESQATGLAALNTAAEMWLARWAANGQTLSLADWLPAGVTEESLRLSLEGLKLVRFKKLADIAENEFSVMFDVTCFKKSNHPETLIFMVSERSDTGSMSRDPMNDRDLLHELNNMNFAIEGFAKLIEADAAPDSDNNRHARRILLAVERAKFLLKNSLQQTDQSSSVSTKNVKDLQGKKSEPIQLYSGNILLLDPNDLVADRLSTEMENAGFEVSVLNDSMAALSLVDEIPEFWQVLIMSAAIVRSDPTIIKHFQGKEKDLKILILLDFDELDPSLEQLAACADGFLSGTAPAAEFCEQVAAQIKVFD